MFPIAEKLYIKLGWQKIHNSNVLVNINSNIPYKEFSINYFKDEYIISIDEANPSARIPIIPFTIYPHRSELLDSNINIYSTKYHNQSSCMGLYNKFNILKKDYYDELKKIKTITTTKTKPTEKDYKIFKATNKE